MSNICKIKCLSSNACSNLQFHCLEIGACFVDCDESVGIDCPSFGVYAYGIWTTTEPTFDPTNNPSMIPSIIPSDNPTQIPSKSPSNLPTTTSARPSTIPSTIPTLQPSINYFEMFNFSQVLDILFNSTLQQYTASNLEKNKVLQTVIAGLLQQVSESKISNTVENIIAIATTQISAHNSSFDKHCQLESELEHTDNSYNYLSWLRFYVKFAN